MEIKFNKNSLSIELEITLECNLNCYGCNRLCNLKRNNKDSYMNINDIHKIFDDIKNNNLCIRKVAIMGGEPTLNPLYMEIYNIIRGVYKINNVFVFSNGINKIPNNIQSYIGRSKIKKFRNMFLSPLETGQEVKDNCRVPNDYGISISKIDGQIKYCLCGCGKMISILTKNKSYLKNNIKEIINLDLKKYQEQICSHCQFSAIDKIYIKNDNSISNIFLDGYKEYMDS